MSAYPNSGHLQFTKPCPLYPRYRHRLRFSACLLCARSGHQQTTERPTTGGLSENLVTQKGSCGDVRLGPLADILRCESYVRFGSKADTCSAKWHVRFAAKSGHQSVRVACPLRAKSGQLSADQMAA